MDKKYQDNQRTNQEEDQGSKGGVSRKGYENHEPNQKSRKEDGGKPTDATENNLGE